MTRGHKPGLLGTMFRGQGLRSEARGQGEEVRSQRPGRRGKKPEASEKRLEARGQGEEVKSSL